MPKSNRIIDRIDPTNTSKVKSGMWSVNISKCTLLPTSADQLHYRC